MLLQLWQDLCHNPFLGEWSQWLTIISVKNVFLTFILNFYWHKLILFLCVLPLVSRERRSTPPPPLVLPTLRKLWAVMRSPLSLSFSKMNKTPFTSATPWNSCLWDLSPSWLPSSGHSKIVWFSSYIDAPKTAHSNWGAATSVQSRGEQSPLLPGWWCTPGHGCLSWPPGHCWLILNLPPTQTHWSVSAGLLSSLLFLISITWIILSHGACSC